MLRKKAISSLTNTDKDIVDSSFRRTIMILDRALQMLCDEVCGGYSASVGVLYHGPESNTFRESLEKRAAKLVKDKESQREIYSHALWLGCDYFQLELINMGSTEPQSSLELYIRYCNVAIGELGSKLPVYISPFPDEGLEEVD